MSCACVSYHAPKPAINQKHHVVPLSWVRDGGKPADPEIVPLCGTAHDSVHTLLNQYVRLGGKPPWDYLQQFNSYIRNLAEIAWANRPNDRPPFTTSQGQEAGTLDA